MARLLSAVEKSVKGSLRKGGRDGLAILIVYAMGVLRGRRGASRDPARFSVSGVGSAYRTRTSVCLVDSFALFDGFDDLDVFDGHGVDSRGFLSRMTRSASLPGSSEPLEFSSRYS